MATYVPNALDATQPTEDKTVESAALEFRTIKVEVAKIDTVYGGMAAITTVANDLNEPVSEIETVAASITNVNTVGSAITNVNTVAGSVANVNATAAAITNVNAVGADLLEPVSEINTVATSIAAVDTVGANIAAVSTVAGISANVTTVAGVAANVTTVAGISANVTSVAGNATNINAVAGNNANVTAVGGSIASVNTVAGNTANVNTVAANTANVTAVGTNIASVNSAATNMAAIIAAPAQASAAAASAVSAANSAASAATALDSFDDRYLGSKASDPTLDNDGNALITGALYYSTSTQSMKVYDGANWITATAAGTTSMLVYKYVATAGQTTFSGAATVGGTMSYTSGNIIVFLNGASLDSTDYTATNGTSVVLSSAASLNDELVVVAFKSFTVADTYTQAQVDALLAGKIGTGSGTVSQSNLATNVAGTGPAFSAYQSSSQNLSASSFTKVQLQTEEFDTNSNFDSSTNYRFTPTVAGYYQVNGTVGMNGNFVLLCSIYKNGSEFKRGVQSSALSLVAITVNALIYMNGSTDYIELYAFNSQATAQPTTTGAAITYFQASMVRST